MHVYGFRDQPQLYGGLNRDRGENLPKQAFRAMVKTPSRHNLLDQFLDGSGMSRRHFVLAVLFSRLTFLAFYARLFIQLYQAVDEVVIACDAGRIPGKPACGPQSRIVRELFDPHIQGVSQAHHQHQGAEYPGLVHGGPAGCGVQRGHELFEGVKV